MTIPPNFFRKTVSKAMVFLVALTCLQSQSLLVNTAHAADSTISGKTFYDSNKNGINDEGDQILPFLKVSLYEGETLVQGPIAIDSTGTYQFTVSSVGNYHVSFSNLPPNYSFSPSNIGSDETIDSDVTSVDGIGIGSTSAMFVIGNQAVADVDAGAYVDTLHVGDYVFQDLNNNGIQDESDSVLTGGTVSLYDANSGTLGSDTTDEAGHYGINATIPACLGPNAFWNTGDPNMNCTGINVAGGYYDLTFTTSANCEDVGISITLVAADSSTLLSKNCGAGIIDLKNSTTYSFRLGPEIGTGTAHLNFTDTELAPSYGIGNIMLTYNKLVVTFSGLPMGYGFTSKSVGEDRSVDSDANPSGSTDVMELFAGDSSDNMDAGICNPCAPSGPSGSSSISGVVWNDANNNGIYESESESHYGGVNISLYDANSDTQIGGQGSTGAGPFTFSNLSAGDYYLIFSNIPPGAAFSPSNAGADDTVDSDVDASGRTGSFHLSDSESVTNLSAGVYGGGGDGDGILQFHVFTDTNGNGVQDMGEPDGASGTITVSDGEDSLVLTPDPSGNIGQTLPVSGGYSLTFSLPSGSFVTARNNPISDISIFGGQLTDLGNIGIYGGPVGEFHLHLFTDNNNNGIQDDGEVDGAPKVYLIINGHDESPIPFQTNGYFNAKLAPGDYSFSLIAYTEEAVTFTGNILGLSTVSIQEDMITSLGNIGYFTGTSGGGGGGSPEDCGHIEDQCGDILFRIFTDTNGNGNQDSGEPNNAPGTQIHIINSGTGGLDVTVTPESDGSISGTIPTGNYTLTVIPVSGYSVTGGSSTIGFSINNNELTDVGARGIYAGGGDSGSGSEDSCDSPCGILTFHVFTDTNGNGAQESYEPNGAIGTSVHVQGGDFDQVVALDEYGNIGGDIYPTTYTLTIIKPSGTTITGGSNPIYVTIADGQSVNAGSRGIFITASGGSSGGGGGVVFGGGNSGSSGSQSTGWNSNSSSNNRSSNNRDSSNRSTSSNTPKQSQVAETPASQSQTLPQVTPDEEPCLLTGGTTPINFYDGSTPDTDYLSSIIFKHNNANRLIQGDGNGHFAGNLPMTRFELLKVAMSSNCVAGGNFNTPNSLFTDVNDDQSEQSRVIGEAHARGVITDFNDQFYPNRPVTLGELIKILLGSSAYFPNGIPVQNLPVTETGITEPSFVQPVEYAKLLDIIGEDGKPIDQNHVVTRDEMAVIIAGYIRAMNRLVVSQ
jgi:serine-aspartate repeat-containing protein C/D/E